MAQVHWNSTSSSASSKSHYLKSVCILYSLVCISSRQITNNIQISKACEIWLLWLPIVAQVCEVLLRILIRWPTNPTLCIKKYFKNLVPCDFQQIKTGVEPPSVFSIVKLVFGEFETNETKEWMEHHWTIALYFVAAYYLFICYGPEYMKNRKPMNLKWTMTWWNFSLAFFSIMACCTILPEFYQILAKPNGFHTSICAPTYVNYDMILCK